MANAGAYDLGIIGAGQLARMCLQAAIDLDVRTLVLAADESDAAAEPWRHTIVGRPGDERALRTLADRARVITVEHELLNLDLLRRLEGEGITFRPPVDALATVVDKREQRRLFDRLRIPQPAWSPGRSVDDITKFADRHGWPVVVKAARGGYDGRGVRVVTSVAEAAEAARDFRGELLVEAYAPIAWEASQLVARRPSGEIVAYPLVETVQADGVCRVLLYPAERADPGLSAAAEEAARRIAEALDVSGILAVECFVTEDGELLANELAARPHNTGHWTIEGCATSQFENHLRGVLDLPLGSAAAVVPAACTVNVFGPADGSDPRSRRAAALRVPGARVHLYGKSARPGRKLGHVTAVGASLAEARKCAEAAAAILMEGVP